MDAAPLLSEEGKQIEVPSSVLRRAGLLLSLIVLACCASLGIAAVCSTMYAAIMSHAVLAFMLGLRHAVDCDHLAAIDNVTRQLLGRDQRPVSVGFWFALGHSTVVCVLTAVLAGGYTWAWHALNHGTDLTKELALAAGIVSVALLGGIGLLNGYVALELFQDWSRLSRNGGAAYDHGEAQLRTALSVIPFLQGVFRRVDRPAKMYLVGFLFGLSFDSATQVGLIGLATMAGTNGQIPPLVVMVLPLCFSVGMCLVDTANGQLMLLTYSWATVEPLQKIFYNFVVTALSAGIALAIGSLELLQIVGQQVGFEGPFWTSIQSVDMATMGYMVIAALLLVFIIGVCCSRLRSLSLLRWTSTEVTSTSDGLA